MNAGLTLNSPVPNDDFEVVDDRVPQEFDGIPKELHPIIRATELPYTKGEQLAQLFAPFCKKMHDIELKINSINADNPTLLDTKLAREIRLSLAREVRLPAEKVKIKGKEMILIEGRLYDNLYGVINNTSKALEMKCEAIEKFAEIQEAKRKETLKVERNKALSEYLDELDLMENYDYSLENMSEEVFDDFLKGKKLAFEKAIEDKKRAEADRIAREKAEAEERERIRLENIRLKKEAEAREKILIVEKARFEELLSVGFKYPLGDLGTISDKDYTDIFNEQNKLYQKEQDNIAIKKMKDERDRKKQQEDLKKAEQKLITEKRLAEAKAKKLKLEQEAKLKLERDERQRVERELVIKQQAEKKRLAGIEAEKKRKITEEKKLALAPDKEKIENYLEALKKVEMPKVKSAEAKDFLIFIVKGLNDLDFVFEQKLKQL